MRRQLLVAILLTAAFAVVVIASITVGFVGEQTPSVVVSQPGVVPYKLGGGFDWGLFALALTGLGTLALAFATGTLAASTWQDVRASQRIAEAAIEANRLSQAEQERRPRLTLSADDEKIHSRAETAEEVYVRLLVNNAPELRAAQGTRVLVDRCVKADGTIVTFGSPALGWTSAAAREHDEAVVVFAGASRILDLGALIRKGSDEPF